MTVLLEIPLFEWSLQLLKTYGPGIVQAFTSLAYAVRAFGYSLVPEGKFYHVLLLEPLHGVTSTLSMTSAVDFMAQPLPTDQAAVGQKGECWNESVCCLVDA